RRDAGALLGAAPSLGACRIRGRGAHLPAGERERPRRPRRVRPDQPAGRHEHRHQQDACAQPSAERVLRRADRSAGDRGQRPLDGGGTALAVSYNLYYLDRRVRATVILSGAKIPGVGGFDFPIPAPPLLATQGTADTINPPSFMSAFFNVA